MGSDLVVRRAQPSDAEDLRRLHAASSDSGRVAFRPRYHVDVSEARRAVRPDTHEFVAVVAQEVVGSASVTFSRVRLGDEDMALAWGSGLTVAPGWRRRGLARA